MLLNYLDKEAADKIWFLCQDRNTDCRRKPEEDCCRFVDDLVCHLHMSMNMSPTYPTVTIFRGLFEEIESTKHRLDRGHAISVNLLRILSAKVCRFPYCRAIALQFLVSLRNCKKVAYCNFSGKRRHA